MQANMNARRMATALASLALSSVVATSASGQGNRPAIVKVAVVVEREVEVRRTFVGTVMPIRTSTVGSSVEGRVVELAVDEGDAVAAGDVLARLRTNQIKIQLAAAEAELQLHKQSLDELEKSLPEEIRQAEARARAAKALTKFTELQLKHARMLFQRKTVSEDDVQEKESVATAAEQKYLENRAALRLATRAAPARIAQAKARVLAQY